MTSVLVADDEIELRATVARELREHGFKVYLAANSEEALDVLGTSHIDVLLADLRLGDDDGIELLQEAAQRSARTRLVLMSAYATARDHQTATEIGAIEVLCKPFTSQELLDAVVQAQSCGAGFRGDVHGLSLVDLLQAFHSSRSSLRIELGGHLRGTIHIKEGEIVDARCAEERGEGALQTLLSGAGGSIRTAPSAEVTPTIHRPFQQLLLDHLCVEEDLRDPPTDVSLDSLVDTLAVRDEEDWTAWIAKARAACSGMDSTLELYVVNPSRGVAQEDGKDLPDGLPASIADLAAAVTAVTGEWTQIEIVCPGHAVALTRVPGSPYTVLASSDTRSARSPARFRSEALRIALLFDLAGRRRGS